MKMDKYDKEILIQEILICISIVLGVCSFVFSIGFLANVAKIWWQVCLGWCWLVLSILIPLSYICIIN